MQLEIHPLSPERVDDYFAFFDRDAFADHPEWSMCYCTYFHFDEELEKQMDGCGRQGLRDSARSLIDGGELTGYLAYAEGRVIGWCNAGEKMAYRRIRAERGLWEDDGGEKIKAVVCFIVVQDRRRQGVATRLLEQVIADARGEGYDYVEAYPATEAKDCFEQFHGHASMYEKHGFTARKSLGFCSVLRKAL